MTAALGVSSEQLNTIDQGPACSFCLAPSAISVAIAGPDYEGVQHIHACESDRCREQFDEALETFRVEPDDLLPRATFGELVTEAHVAINLVEDAADAFGRAARHEMALEDARQALRPLVVDRIAAAYNKSPTAAEKLLEADVEYMDHRRKQYDAVIEKERHRGEYDAAKLRARLCVALIEVHIHPSAS
jgi:hypothetical protein